VPDEVHLVHAESIREQADEACQVLPGEVDVAVRVDRELLWQDLGLLAECPEAGRVRIEDDPAAIARWAVKTWCPRSRR
jgi:hypothetical protein